MIKIAIHGAGGRMGRRLIAIGAQDSDVELVAALEAEDSTHVGSDAGALAGIGDIGLAVAADFEMPVEVVIDFSVHQAVDSILARCVDRNVPLVIATTGMSESQHEKISQAADSLPIVWAPSMSVTVNIAMRLAQQAASALAKLDQQVDAEIIEKHHRFKVDAPSGTALRFGELIAEPLGLDQPVHGREGVTGQRSERELGYHAVRVGDNPGEHNILFGLLGESLELRVAASNRDGYATGAFAAAKFLQGQAPGLYNMFDVLELNGQT